MLAAYAARTDADDPLAALEVGERPEPDPTDGWTVVDVRATSLNHHDLWSLRGVGLPEDRLPMILGCDAAGVDADGNEVIVHSVVGERRLARRRDARPQAHAALRAPPGHAGRACRGAAPQPRAQAGGALVRGGRVPADRMADRLPDAVRARRRAPGETVLVQGAGGGVASALIALAGRPACACG